MSQKGQPALTSFEPPFVHAADAGRSKSALLEAMCSRMATRPGSFRAAQVYAQISGAQLQHCRKIQTHHPPDCGGEATPSAAVMTRSRNSDGWLKRRLNSK
jgi:hypothetical protein